jgi:glycoprotein endo-alpha-1,2-mannosidase
MKAINILLLACGLSAVKAASVASVEHLFTEEANLPPIPSNITVGAYYYPWHGNDFHRGDGYLRDQLDPRHQPTLGEYDDTKPEVIAQHLAWSRQANINLWVTSFWGKHSREDNTIRNNILPHNDLGDHKIALLYESTGRMKKAENYTTQRLGPDMAHMCKNIFPHPNYYRVDGRPVVMLYVTRALYTQGVLEQMVEALRTTAREECDQEVFLIGDQVWGEAPPENVYYPPFSMLDAVTNYDVYGNMNGAPYAGQAVVDRYYNEGERWKSRAAKDGVRFIPAVSPGYNDRGVRLPADHIGGSRRLTADDEEGSLFVAQLQKARYLVDDKMDRLIFVNSFNEWHEDSQIEPAVGEPTTLPLHLTNGLEYVGYEELYLNILQAATCDSSCDPIDENKELPLPEGPNSGNPLEHLFTEEANNPPIPSSITVGAASAEHLFTEEANLPPIPSNITVGAYYYPWHGNDFHRGDGYLRDQLDPRHQPTLGEYDDTKPEVIAQHLAWSRQANINLWVTSFWGKHSREDNTIRNNILPHNDLGDHKIALLYESTGRMKKAENYTTQRLGPDMAHMCKNIFPHPNYYRVDGRPVVMLYVTRALYTQGVLEQMVEALRTTAREECDQEVFLIGDQVWGEAPPENVYYPPFSMLDAVTNYDVYGNMNGAPYAGQAVVDRYYNEGERWKSRAAKDGVRFIPAVSPGYNDRGVRLPADHIGGSRRLTADDEEGSLFVAQLQKARYLVDDKMDRLIFVNSFNEWHEDSQIEPAVGEPTTLPLHLTNGLEYVGYEELYLNILRTATCDSSCDPIDENKELPLPEGPHTGPTPSDLLVGAYYYPWYGSDFNGGTGYLRSQLDQRQEPILGEYDDTESQVVDEHLKWSRQANIGLWVTSWRGPTHPIDSTIRNVILPHPKLGDHKIALLYEIGTRMSENDNWDTSRVASDLEYICDFYFSEPNYFRVHGRPVIFLSLTRKLYSASVLERVTVLMRTIAGTFGHDIYLVGDQVWSAAPVEEIYLPFLLLDAVTNLDIYGNMISPGLAGQEAVDDYYDKQKDWRNRAWSLRCGFIPGVTPGFNDRGLKPSAQHKVLSRQLTADSQPGSLFSASVDKAKYLVDSELNNLMMVNSFNQWHEDTQIEPAMGKDTSSPETLTAGNTYYGYGDLYLELLRNATLAAPSTPGEDHESGMFHPLLCNTDVRLPEMPCDKTWLSSFGNSNSHLLEVVVPCGECIMLDHPGPTLILEGGIDIQGKLLIPDGIEIIIKTPYVRVQGELHVSSTKVVDSVPGITFLLFEGDDGIEKFLPASSNKLVCGTQRCDPGPQSIMVAGGRVVIHGLPANTPTWVDIIDVISTAEEPPIPVPSTCPVNGVYINEGFELPYPSAFTGTPGAFVEFDGAGMKVLDRTSIHHGVQLDLKAVNECLTTNTPYTLLVKLRLIKPQHEGDYSSCSVSAENCLAIHAEYSSDQEALGSSLKYEEAVWSNVRYGEWFEINEEFTFDEQEVDTSNIYLTMRISGVEAGVDIEVDNLSLRLSVHTTCSRSPPDCRDLIACNGNGEDGEDESPFYPEGDAEITLQVEDGNYFWNAVRLSSDSAIAGIGWRVPDSCLKESAVYKFRMRIRVHPHEDSPENIFTAVYIRSHRKASDTQRRMAKCPPSSGEWVSCETYFTVTPDMLGDLAFVRMFIETVGSSSVMYDIDDLSFEFVHMEAPVIGLVVDGAIKDKWGVGAEILITSHTLNWDDQTVRAIASVENYGDEGKVLIALNATIDARPPTTSDSYFAAEVALLSRNIVFEGSRESKDGPLQGGHLVVYHTASIPQIIEGAEFRNFGQQGTLGRYVSFRRFVCRAHAPLRVHTNIPSFDVVSLSISTILKVQRVLLCQKILSESQISVA